MEATHISVVSVPVSNPDVAKAFYVEMLGFEEVMDNKFGAGMRWSTRSGARAAIS